MTDVVEYKGILIDYSRDSLLREQGLTLLTGKGFYKKDYEESPQETFARPSVCFSFGDYDFAQRMYNYASKHWFVNASPLQSNSVDVEWPSFREDQFEEAAEWLEENVTPDGMPISCFLSMITDNKDGLVETRKEIAWLSMMGGGIGLYAGNRSPDEKSTGVMAHLKGYDADALSYKQTEKRRGSIGVYLDVDHPEIMSFIDMRNPAGGESSKKCFNLNNAVNLTDKFMYAVIAGEEYELVDPKHGPTGNFLNAREVFEKICELRSSDAGEPYCNFIDTVNRARRPWIRKPTYHVRQSNLCNEIHLMTSAKRTAVCCLSSINLEKFDEWKDDPLFIKDMVRYLDNVLEYFIRLAPPELKRAVYSAQKERAIGLGTLGFHSYLQSKMIPFESGGFNSASQINSMIFSHIEQKAIEASLELGHTRGEPDDTRGSGMRNSHLIALAPNASSSNILGVSPSIEPWADNVFATEGRAGSSLVKNKHLEALLESLGKNTDAVWNQIMQQRTVAGLDFLTPEQKAVFKTAREINPMWIIEHAANRQPHVCQGQSVNMFHDNTWSAQEIMDVHIAAWAKGLKGLYYFRGKAEKQANVGKGTDKSLNALPVRQTIEFDTEGCLSCEG